MNHHGDISSSTDQNFRVPATWGEKLFSLTTSWPARDPEKRAGHGSFPPPPSLWRTRTRTHTYTYNLTMEFYISLILRFMWSQVLKLFAATRCWHVKWENPFCVCFLCTNFTKWMHNGEVASACHIFYLQVLQMDFN